MPCESGLATISAALPMVAEVCRFPCPQFESVHSGAASQAEPAPAQALPLAQRSSHELASEISISLAQHQAAFCVGSAVPLGLKTSDFDVNPSRPGVDVCLELQ